MVRRIGILAEGFAEWGGGIDFLRLICSSILAADPTVELHLLLPDRGPRLATIRALRGVKRALISTLVGYSVSEEAKRPTSQHIADLIGEAEAVIHAHTIDIGSGAVARAARRLKLDAVLPAIKPLQVGKDLPWLGYIYDYQHVHLPQLFSPQEIKRRDDDFSRMLELARCVIVNARAVAADIKTYHPQHRAKILTLPFAAAPNPRWLESAQAPTAKYGITGRYFIVSNQFWQHKDHLTIWRAFARIRQDHPDIRLVCTGETQDYRNPNHMATLSAEADRLGITDRLHILGLIPKSDQIALLRNAIAVIQATLSEGGPGGGCIFDSVSLGVPSIVSNIPVNLELNEPTVRFFRTGDPDALAGAMHEHIVRPPSAPPSKDHLVGEGQRRRIACGRSLLIAAAEMMV
ncbi:glycosyl transferase, group 1 [Rubrivivax gelatinosus IL144]|uniref:Glycosyl transferase, group 1 n=1 Tax=Rubrivivax gelatinosus (strain NBRC 100245 / IL144) TaxID=983917 RepID=I0HWT4_RUBGI|nr:glycosyl transferase, group 1 [Rubrivivax gelatinosus IL144]